MKMWTSKNKKSTENTHKVEDEDSLDMYDIEESDLRGNKDYEKMLQNNSDNICWCFQGILGSKGGKLKDVNEEKEVIVNKKITKDSQQTTDAWWCDLSVNSRTQKIQKNAIDNKKVITINRKNIAKNEKHVKAERIKNKLEPYKSLLTIPCKTKLFPFDMPNKLMPFLYPVNPVVRQCPTPRNRYYVPQNRYPQVTQLSRGESYRTSQIRTSQYRSAIKKYPTPREKVHEHQPTYVGSVRSIYWGDTDVRRRSSFLQHQFPDIDGIHEITRYRNTAPNRLPPTYRELTARTERTPSENNTRRYSPQQITTQSERPLMDYHMGARQTVPRQAVARQAVPRQTVPRPRQGSGEVPTQIRKHYGGRYATAANPQVPRRYSSRSEQRHPQWQQQHRTMFINKIEYNHMHHEFSSRSRSDSCVSDSSYLTDESGDFNFENSSFFDDRTLESVSDRVSRTYFELSDTSFVDENPDQGCICFETGKPRLVLSNDEDRNNIQLMKYNDISNNSMGIDSGSSSTPSSYMDGTFRSFVDYEHYLHKRQQASSLINTRSFKSNRKTNKDILNILLYDSYTVPAREQLNNRDFLLYYMFVAKIKIFKHRSTQCIQGHADLDLNATELCCTFTKIVITKSTNRSTIGTAIQQIADAKENINAVAPKAIKCVRRKSKIPVPCNLKKHVKASTIPIPCQLNKEPRSEIIYIPKVLSGNAASSSKQPVKDNSVSSAKPNIPVLKSSVQENNEYDYEIALDNVNVFEYKKEEHVNTENVYETAPAKKDVYDYGKEVQEMEWHSQVAVLRYKSQVSAFIEDLVKQMMQPKSPLHSKRSSKQKSKLSLLIKHLIEEILEPTLASEILRNLKLVNVSIGKDKPFDAVEIEAAAQILLQIQRPKIRLFIANLLHDKITKLLPSEHFLVIPFIRSLLDAILHKEIVLKIAQKLEQNLSATDNLCRQRTISLTFVQNLIAEELNHDIALLVLKSLAKHSAENVFEDKNKLVSLAFLKEVLNQKLKPEIASELFHKMELESIQLPHNVNEQKSLSLTYIKNVFEEVLKPKTVSKVLKNLSKKSSLDNSGDSDKNRSIPFSTVKEVVKETVKPEEANEIFKKMDSAEYEKQKFIPIQSVKDTLEQKVDNDITLEIIQTLLAKGVTVQNVSVETANEVIKQNLNVEDASRVLMKIDEEHAYAVIELDSKATIPLSTIKSILEDCLEKAEANKVYQKLSSKSISSWRFRRGSRQQSVSVPFVKQTVETTLQPQIASKVLRKVSSDVASRRYSEELKRSASLPLPFVKNLIMETVDPKTASQILNKISSKTKQEPGAKNTVPLPVVKDAIQEVLEPDAKKQSSISHQLQKSSTSDSIASLIQESLFSSPTTHTTNRKSLRTSEPSNRRDNNKLSSIIEDSAQENKELSDHKYESVEYELLSSRLRPIASQKTDVVIPLQKTNVLEVVEERSDTDSVPPVLEPLAPRNVKIMGTTKKRRSGGDVQNTEGEEFLDLYDDKERREREDTDYEKMLNELMNKDRYFYTITGIPKERPQEISEKMHENLGKFYKEPFDYSGCVSGGNYEPVFDCIDPFEHEKSLHPTDLVESKSNIIHISSMDDMEKYLHGIDHNGVINPEFFDVVQQKSGMPVERATEKEDLIYSVSESEFSDYKYFGPEILKYPISSIPTDTDFEPIAHNINSYRFLAEVPASEPKALIDILKHQLEEEKTADCCCHLECALIEEAEPTYSQFKDISVFKETSAACLVRYTYSISSQTEMDEKFKSEQDASGCPPLFLQLSCNCGCCVSDGKLLNSRAVILKSRDVNLSAQTQTSQTAFIKSKETQTGTLSVADDFKKTDYESILHISCQNFSNTGIQTYAPSVPVSTTRGTMTTVKQIKSKCTCCVCENDINTEYSYTCSCSPYHTYKNVHYKTGISPNDNLPLPFKFETHVHVTPSPCISYIPPQHFLSHGPSPYSSIPYCSYSTAEGLNAFQNVPAQNNGVHKNIPALYTIPEEHPGSNIHNPSPENRHGSSKTPQCIRQTCGDVSASTSEHMSRSAPSSDTTHRSGTETRSRDLRSRLSNFNCMHAQDFCSTGEPGCSNRVFNIGNAENSNKGFRFDFRYVKKGTSTRGLSDSKLNEQPFRFKAVPQQSNNGNRQSNSFKFRNEPFANIQSDCNHSMCASQCAQSFRFSMGGQNSFQGSSRNHLEQLAKARSQQSRQLVSANASQTSSANFAQNNKSTAIFSEDRFQISPDGYINFVAKPVADANGLSHERRKHFDRIADAYNMRINTPDAETSDPQKPTTEDENCMFSCNKRASFVGTKANWKNYNTCSSGMEFSQPSRESSKQNFSQNINMFDASGNNGRSTAIKSTNNRNIAKLSTSTSIQEKGCECERISIKNTHLLSKAVKNSLPQGSGTSSKPVRKNAEKRKLNLPGQSHKYSAFSKTDSSSPLTETEKSKHPSKDSGQS